MNEFGIEEDVVGKEGKQTYTIQIGYNTTT